MGTQRVVAERYSLVEPLPGSATGIGWRARDLWSGQLVAITRVPVSGLVGHELLRAYHEIAGEVRALNGLQHDRIVRTMEVVLDADDLWVAAELLPGVTMADELARRGAVGPQEVARGANPSPTADVFALGATLYLAVEGRGPLLAAADQDQLLAAVAFAVAAPQRAGRLSELLMRMLHPDPAWRPAVVAVADQLRQLAGAPAGPPGPAAVGPPP
ncbi:MAG: hypothetical protein ACRDTA_25315, partial [Pseudonocardiaceae bacterium]